MSLRVIQNTSIRFAFGSGLSVGIVFICKNKRVSAWVGYFGWGMGVRSLACTLVRYPIVYVCFVRFTVLGSFGHMTVFSDLQKKKRSPNKQR